MFLRLAGLHLVDGFDEVEEGFGAFGLVGDFTSGFVGRLDDGVIFQVFKDIAIKMEFLSGTDV